MHRNAKASPNASGVELTAQDDDWLMGGVKFAQLHFSRSTSPSDYPDFDKADGLSSRSIFRVAELPNWLCQSPQRHFDTCLHRGERIAQLLAGLLAHPNPKAEFPLVSPLWTHFER